MTSICGGYLPIFQHTCSRAIHILVCALTACCASIRFFGYEILSSAQFDYSFQLVKGCPVDDSFASRQNDGKRILALVEVSPEISENIKRQFRLTLGAPEIRKYVLFPGNGKTLLSQLLINKNIFDRIALFEYGANMILTCKQIFSMSYRLVNRLLEFFETGCLHQMTALDLKRKLYILNAWFLSKTSQAVEFSLIHILYKIMMTSSCSIPSLAYEGEKSENYRTALSLSDSYVRYFGKICPTFIPTTWGGEPIG